MNHIPGFFVWVVLSFWIVSPIQTYSGQLPEQLLEADRRVSAFAKSNGILEALTRHLATEGVVFPISGHPISGKQLLEQASAPSIDWMPKTGIVSADGTLGHTYGSYDLGGKIHYYGTVWTRQTTGHWQIAATIGLPISLSSSSSIPEPNSKTDFGPNTGDVVNIERQFASYARNHGIPAAFYRFIAPNGIALSSSGPPRDRSTYKKLMRQSSANGNPASDLLEWGPLKSRVAGSNDLAYNFGPYRYSYLDKKQNKQVAYGYFFTVWQKQSGIWKFLFDGGNTCQNLSAQFLKKMVLFDN